LKLKLKLAKQRLAIQPINQHVKTDHKVKINPEHGTEIADGYDQLKHRPNDPDVKASYDSLINETKQQYDDLIKGGLKVTKLKKDEAGYVTADEMHKDITENHHLKYFPTEHGFGANAENFQDHPMLRGTGEIDLEGKDIPANDLFRIVHDIQGHNLSQSDFSPEGEHKAYLTHKQQYSPLAGKALFTETAGQANWGAFNRKSGESNRQKILRGQEADLDFAEQKAGLFPDSIINKRHHQ
jgi:hypothetical protein